MPTPSISIDQVLNNLKIKALNHMQQAALAAARNQKDVVLLSNTGSGKTLAFLLPILEMLDPETPLTQALVIAPSRELALQIEQVFKQMGTGFKITCCYGGHMRETEENNLLEAPALIIGTPGRLADHIRRQNIKVQNITLLVLDEFDKSLELGFHEEMAFIIGELTALKQHILTSATEAVHIPPFVQLHEPERLNFLTGERPDALAVQLLQSDDKDKSDTLFRLICMLGNRSTVVFLNHREAVERTSEMLTQKGITNVHYHGAMEQNDRDAALCKFKNGTSNVLVTTDLASRGLDIPHIRYIIHYHLPATEDAYTHRNGRTARMDASGTAILILSAEEYTPPYIAADATTITLPEEFVLPEKPKWSTLFIAAGKKDKVNKVDIVGFLSHKANLKKEDIGLIDVKDFYAYVAVKKIHVSETLRLIKNEKIKNMKVKIDVAR